MKPETKNNARLPDEEVIVKLNICQQCEGIVTAAVKHVMDIKSKNSFAKEAMEYNLKVTEQPLLEYRKTNAKWCDCIK